MDLDPILLIGAGGHCKSCIELIESESKFKITGIVDKEGSKITSVLTYRVLGNDKDFPILSRNSPNAFLAVGQIKSPTLRIRLYNEFRDQGAFFPVVSSPNAVISVHSSIGEGTAVFHNAVVNASAQVGKNCILNNNCLIEHDVNVGSYCHVSTGAIVNGGVTIEDSCFIGSGSILHEGIIIGKGSVISAGQVIRRSIRPNSFIK